MKKNAFIALCAIVFMAAMVTTAEAQPEKREVFYSEETQKTDDTHTADADTPTKREVYTIKDEFHNPTRQLDWMREAKTTTIDFIGRDDWKNRRSRSGKMKGHWAGVTLYYSGLVSGLGDLSLPAGAGFMSQTYRSIGISINPFRYTLPVSRNAGFVTGLGFELNNFRFDENMKLSRENGTLVPDYTYDQMGIDLKKSKLFTSYVNIPVMFEAQFGTSRNFFVNGGVVGGMLLGSHTKVKSRPHNINDKKHGGLGLRNFHYGYIVNAGFHNIVVSAVYYDSKLFRKGAGPDLRQVNIGLSLMW